MGSRRAERSARRRAKAKAESGRARPASDHAYRADVDGLRAVAVTAVMIYHMEHAWLPGGFTGVDVFFVISGFVVSGSLLHKQSSTVPVFLASFYARRVKRLAPALACVILLGSLAAAMLIPPPIAIDLDDYYVSAAWGLVGMANNHFAARGTAYSDEGPEALEYNPFTHLWSLGVEEQCAEPMAEP
jgi:peptidoglycan/LPS O-acetylase OafA/YrhL